MKAFLRTYGMTLAAGVVLALSFPTFDLYPLAWLALIPLFYRACTHSPGDSAKHFFLAGWVFYSILWQWILTNLFWAGGWAIVGQQALCLIMAAYWALFGMGWCWMFRRLPRAMAPLTAAVLWAAFEQLEGTLFTGFGAGSIAYSQGNDLPLLQWSAIGGASLVSAIVVYVNATLALALATPSRRILNLAVAVAVIAAAHTVGYVLLDAPDYASKPLKVGIFQSNFPIEMKYDPEYTESMVANAAEKSVVLAKREEIDLMVWPEALIMDPIDMPAISQAVASFIERTESALYTGAARFEPDPYRGFNSSYFINKSGEIEGVYDKIHLAPFGEYMPLGRFFPFIQRLVPAIGAASPGTEPKVFSIEGRRFGPLICFEVLFPAMAERLRRDGADFLVVITNLAWFGSSNAIPQELEFARIRAIETRLPLVHAANTGISGVFDPWGRFSLMDGGVDASGYYFHIVDDVRPKQTMRVRLASAFPLAAPGHRPLSYGPAAIPWILVAATPVLVLAALLSGRRKKHREKPT